MYNKYKTRLSPGSSCSANWGNQVSHKTLFSHKALLTDLNGVANVPLSLINKTWWSLQRLQDRGIKFGAGTLQSMLSSKAKLATPRVGRQGEFSLQILPNQKFGNQTFNCIRLAKVFCEFNCWFASDVTAAMLVVKNKRISLHWEMNSILMQI